MRDELRVPVHWPAVYPFRTAYDEVQARIVAAFPDECEPACLAVPEPDSMADMEWHEWHENAAKRWDERQCRGCGRWGIFTPRAITANLPNGTITLGPCRVFVRTPTGKWQYVAEVPPSVQRPDDGCPCCAYPTVNAAIGFGLNPNDCWCRTDCGVQRCQAREM